MPRGKDPWLTPSKATEPVLRSASMPAQPLVFPQTPASLLTGGVKLTRTFPMGSSTARAKRIPQEMELLIGVPLLRSSSCNKTIFVFWGWTSSQQSPDDSNALQDLLRLHFRLAVRDKSSSAYSPTGPAGAMFASSREREMQEDVPQQGAATPACGVPLPRGTSVPPPAARGLPATADIEEDPPALGVPIHCAQNERVVEVVEEASDVQVDDPVVPPASLPAAPTASSADFSVVAIGVRVKAKALRKNKSA